jgi:hypothetical protein
VFAPLPNGPALAEQLRLVNALIVLLIAGSVAWATIAAWPLGWLLGVLGGAPSGVAIVGAHGLGRAVGRALRQEGVEVILLDSNAARVLSARACGLDAEVIDATDTAALAGALREREIGWLLGWTGNADVDRIVERWGRAAFGDGHATMALPTPPGGSDARAHALSERPTVLRELDAGCADGVLRPQFAQAGDSADAGIGAVLALRDAVVVGFADYAGSAKRTRYLRLVRADDASAKALAGDALPVPDAEAVEPSEPATANGPDGHAR